MTTQLPTRPHSLRSHHIATINIIMTGAPSFTHTLILYCAPISAMRPQASLSPDVAFRWLCDSIDASCIYLCMYYILKPQTSGATRSHTTTAKTKSLSVAPVDRNGDKTVAESHIVTNRTPHTEQTGPDKHKKKSRGRHVLFCFRGVCFLLVCAKRGRVRALIKVLLSPSVCGDRMCACA